MSLIPLIEDEGLYLRIFAEQNGYGMPRYRGSPMIGGSFWGRLVTFAKGLFRQAAPHVSELLSKAHPHVKGLASQAVETAIDRAVTHVTDKLKKVQEGKGIKGRARKTEKKKARRPRAESNDNF